MTIIYANLIVSPTGNYIVKPVSSNNTLSNHMRSCFVYALTDNQSDEVRAAIVLHETLARKTARECVEKHNPKNTDERYIFTNLLTSLYRNIQLQVQISAGNSTVDTVKVKLVIPTLAGLREWDLGFLSNALSENEFGLVFSEGDFPSPVHDPLPWED